MIQINQAFWSTSILIIDDVMDDANDGDDEVLLVEFVLEEDKW